MTETIIYANVNLIIKSSSDSHAATINVDGSTINLKKISNLYLGSMYAIFESDKGESVRLEITENQDSSGPALARILDTEYDEFD